MLGDARRGSTLMGDPLAEALRSAQERALAITRAIRADQKRARGAHSAVAGEVRCPRTMATAKALRVMTDSTEDVAQAYV